MSNMPYIGEKYHTNPFSSIDDGFIDTYFLKDSNWISLLSTALSFTDGSCFDLQKKKPKRNDMTYLFATEFIIEVQSDEPGLFSVDGEKVLAKKIVGV